MFLKLRTTVSVYPEAARYETTCTSGVMRSTAAVSA
jgi:hypothetical protein